MKEIMVVVVARLVVYMYEMRLSKDSNLGEGSEEMGEGRRRKGELQMRDLFVGKADGPLVDFRRRK